MKILRGIVVVAIIAFAVITSVAFSLLSAISDACCDSTSTKTGLNQKKT